MAEHDPWALSSGLVDEFTADVKDAIFAFDPEYNDGETLVLKLDIQSDDAEVGREGNGSDTILYPMGKGWETGDKGKTTRHESGKAKNFNSSSGYGLMIASALEVEALSDVLKKKGGPTDSAIWKGLNLDFKRVEHPYVMDGEARTRRVLHVVGYNAANAAKGAKGAKADTATAAAPAISAKLKLQLKNLAKSATDHDDFIEKAITDVEGVSGDDAVEAMVMDEAWFESLR